MENSCKDPMLVAQFKLARVIGSQIGPSLGYLIPSHCHSQLAFGSDLRMRDYGLK